ncbi:MAG: alkaline phosphatase family protein [Terriglobales bacterium]|jgi:phospholipase C
MRKMSGRPGTILPCGLLLCTMGLLLLVLNACGGSSANQTGPNFQISAAALSPATVNPGKPATSTVTVTAMAGFSGSVALACSGLPSGASCAFVPASVAGSGTSKLTISTSGTTTPGSYPVGVQGSSGSTDNSAPLSLIVQSVIQHVVIIFQENRTPDNLFQDPVLVARGADIQNYGIDSNGDKIPLTPITLSTDYDMGHSHKSFLLAYDNGKMDGADLDTVTCNPGAPSCPQPDPEYRYVQASDVAPYFQLAETYTFGDRMFQTNQGPSFPAHQFIISGTSAPTPPGDQNSDLFDAENPAGSASFLGDTGCTAPAVEVVNMIDPGGSESIEMYPCFDHPTLTDIFDTAKISWRYYAPSPGSIWTGPNAIQHLCVPNVPPPNGASCTGPDWINNVILKNTQVLTDIANGQLASVSWVIPTGQESDHASINNGTGPSWVASVVNAIGNSPYWSNTAIIITWDDWGGWYDHVPPPAIINSYEYGLRVPMIVVSPYAKPAYISHQVNDFGSILKFIEGNFGVGTVAPGASPAYADATTNTFDLSDCFDFNQTPLTFQTIPAAKDAKYFLEDKTPPSDPDDD